MCSRFADVDFTQMLQILIISAIEKKYSEKMACNSPIYQLVIDFVCLAIGKL